MFGRGLRLFRLLGFEVRLDTSWLIIAALVIWTLAGEFFPSYIQGLPGAAYWWMAAVGAAGFFFCIVLHELGHSLVARQFGIPMHGITLFIFGGVAEMGGEPPSAKSEFFTAIAGPITSFFLAGIAYGLRVLCDTLAGPIELTGILYYLAWINVALAVFNLVPAFPLDGGRVLRSVLWALKGDLVWATRIASVLGTGFALLLVAWGVINFFMGDFIAGLWRFVLGLFIRNASQFSYQQVVLRESLANEPVRRFMNQNPITVPPATTLRDLVENYVYRYDFKVFPVVEDNRLLGCITIDQLKQVPRQEWEHRTALELVRPCTAEDTIPPDTEAIQALAAMKRTRFARLMVVDQDRLVGVIALRDLLNFLSRKMELGA